jgi:hypothetical protein
MNLSAIWINRGSEEHLASESNMILVMPSLARHLISQTRGCRNKVCPGRRPGFGMTVIWGFARRDVTVALCFPIEGEDDADFIARDDVIIWGCPKQPDPTAPFDSAQGAALRLSSGSGSLLSSKISSITLASDAGRNFDHATVSTHFQSAGPNHSEPGIRKIHAESGVESGDFLFQKHFFPINCNPISIETYNY